MSHALLLRLFLSPYFSIPVAMHYLKTYSDSIGISHYLCWRMKGMRAEEVESFWPQICHLLLTYPTESNALESFILQRAAESTHSAMLTFWFMQAALRDLTPTRQTNPRPFFICQRVLHRCHEILFGDPPEPTRTPYRSFGGHPATPAAALQQTTTALGRLLAPDPTLAVKVKINAHILPALVGMGVALSGPGMPELHGMAGEWAVMQGRRPRDENKEGRARVEDVATGADPKGRALERNGASNGKMSSETDGLEEDSGDERAHPRKSPDSIPLPASAGRTPPLQPLSSPNPQKHLHPAQTAPHLWTSHPSPRHSLDQRSPTHEPVDPFSQLSPPLPSTSRITPNASPRAPHVPHHHSVPDLTQAGGFGRSKGLRPTNHILSAEELLSGYSADMQRQLLRAHYCRSEIKFLLTLEDISNRLLVVPKPARVPALRAELTSLNHNLPAEICMPLWCAADHSHEEGGETASSTPLKSRPDHRLSSSKKRGHSRVVRISPGDSVVLNSAERAPFLLHVEILDGDLDFDPTRRENRDLLKRLVVAADIRRRKREMGGESYGMSRGRGSTAGLGLGLEGSGFGSLMPEAFAEERLQGGQSGGSSTRRDEHLVGLRGSNTARESRGSELPEPIDDGEEVDLVEQLYGARLSVKDKFPELTDALPLPSGPKNKALDMAAWDRGSESPTRRLSLTPQTPQPPIFSDALSVGEMPLPNRTLLGSGSSLNGHPSASIPATSPSVNLASRPSTPGISPLRNDPGPRRVITLEDYSERMRTAAVMLAQLQASLIPAAPSEAASGGRLSWIPGTGWILGTSSSSSSSQNPSTAMVPGSGEALQPAANIVGQGGKLKLAAVQAEAIRSRIMEEMMALEEERVARMTEGQDGEMKMGRAEEREGGGIAEDEGIVRRELNKADPSAAVFKESWTAKKSRIRASSPWGHLANWNVISVIVKTGTDLRQEQLATQLIERFSKIFKEEKCDCWVRSFRILITGEQSGLVETITDAVSVHSIKKGEYARRIAEGGAIGQVSLMDHFVNTYGKPDSGRFARAQRAFIRSLAGYSIVTYLLQIKDRHNGNILVDRDGHLIHIDFGFMLSNSPGGNMGFEAAPFKLPLEYVEIMGGLESAGWQYFKQLFKEGFEAARKHSDSLITTVELMQKDSKLDCFILFGDQTAHHLRERFALGLTTAAVETYLERLIVNSTGSNYTRLYDTFQYYSQGVL